MTALFLVAVVGVAGQLRYEPVPRIPARPDNANWEAVVAAGPQKRFLVTD